MAENDLRLRLWLALFLGSLAFFAFSILYTPKARAAVLQWVVKGPVYVSTTYEYGWHFNESGESGNWGAKDFSKGSYPDTVLYAIMQLSTGVWWRYTVYDPGMPTCRAYAYAAYSENGYAWYGVYGLDLHFVHLSSVTAGWTNSMRYYGEFIWYSVGTIATSSPCLYDGPHVHLSSDLADIGSPTYVFRANLSNETCWASSDSKCNISSYTKKHVSGSTCPPGQYTTTGGPFPRSGTPSQYLCETWSEKGHPQTLDVFQMWF